MREPTRPLQPGDQLHFQRIAYQDAYPLATVTVTSARRDGLASRNYDEPWMTWHGRATMDDDPHGPQAIVQATGSADGRPEYWTVKGWLDR